MIGTAGLIIFLILAVERLGAVNLRADDELTLLSQDSDSSYQADYRATQTSLSALLESARHQLPESDAATLLSAQSDLSAYEAAHGIVRTDDLQKNDLLAAIKAASASGSQSLPTTSEQLDQSLTGGIAASQSSFDHSTASASSDLVGLQWGIVLLALSAAILLVIGVRPRIQEYR